MTIYEILAYIIPVAIYGGVLAYIYNKDFFGVYAGLATLFIAFIWATRVYEESPLVSLLFSAVMLVYAYDFIRFFEESITKAQGEIDWMEFAKEHGLYNRPKQFEIEVFSIATALGELIIDKSGRKDAIVEFSTNKSTLQVELKKDGEA